MGEPGYASGTELSRVQLADKMEMLAVYTQITVSVWTSVGFISEITKTEKQRLIDNDDVEADWRHDAKQQRPNVKICPTIIDNL